jgi:hypothetical protein
MSKFNKNLSRQEEARQRREVLKSISKKARLLRENRPEFEDWTINEILMAVLYNRKGDREFKKFREWKEEGYTIKKGEKGFMLWAQPLSELKKQEGEEPDPEGDDSSFFPVCYLFSNEQVIKPEAKQKEPRQQSQQAKKTELVPDFDF